MVSARGQGLVPAVSGLPSEVGRGAHLPEHPQPMPNGMGADATEEDIAGTGSEAVLQSECGHFEVVFLGKAEQAVLHSAPTWARNCHR